MSRTTIALIVALVVSVAVNLLILGTIIGHRAAMGGQAGAARMHAGGFEGPRDRDGFTPLGPLDRAFRTVPEEMRPQIRERLEADRSEIGAQLARVREARNAVSKALGARPFDRAAADAALAALRAEINTSQKRLHDAVTASMAAAEAEGRLPPPRPPRNGRPDTERPRPD